MSRQLNVSGSAVRQVATPLMLCFAFALGAMGDVEAAQPGHGRVTSVPGAPLSVSVPVRGLSPDDLKVLNATIADPSAWAQAGLTLPAAIETLSVSLEPGLDPASRTLVMRSTQVVDRPVIDVLIRLKTADGTTSIQSSYLVLTRDSSSKGAGSVRVARGDTLYAIALSKAVSGADIYQVMWAIYEANPQAFIAENMNLLRAGVTLNIPDATTMRAVDAKFARSMFAKHDQSFRARRGAGQAPTTTPTVSSAATQVGVVTSPQPASSATPAGDQVRLDSTNPADQQSDASVAQANELREMQARVEALQKNVEDLKDALKKSQALASSGQASGSGESTTSGASGAGGATGAAGATGATGATGAVGAAGATGATGATGGATGATGAGSSSSAVVDGSSQDTSANGSREVKTGFAKIKQYASDHVLGLVLGISALLALLIAFLLRRAGHNAPANGGENEPRIHAGMASEFDQKLQSIDLNLSGDDKSPTASGITKSGA